MIRNIIALWRFWHAIAWWLATPTAGAISILKRKDGLMRVVLYRRHVSDRILDYQDSGQHPQDRLGVPDYRVMFDRIEWPFPSAAFPDGTCPTCYFKVPLPRDRRPK